MDKNNNLKINSNKLNVSNKFPNRPIINYKIKDNTIKRDLPRRKLFTVSRTILNRIVRK